MSSQLSKIKCCSGNSTEADKCNSCTGKEASTDVCNITPNSSMCPAFMNSICSSEQGWIDSPTNKYCTDYAKISAGYERTMARAIVTSYFNTQFSDFNDPRLETVTNLCALYPGVCDDILIGLCSRYTRGQLGTTPGLGKLCGCFLPTNQQPYNKFGVSPECDSLCTIGSTLKRGVSGGDKVYTEKTCGKTNCIIDNVSIAITNSTTEGVNFNQLCGNCGEGGCTCTLSNLDVNLLDSSVKKIDFVNNCGVCNYTTDNGTTISCQEAMDIGAIPTIENSTVISSDGVNYKAYVMYGVGVVVIGIIIFIIYKIKK